MVAQPRQVGLALTSGKLAGAGGFEPPVAWLTARCLTAWLRSNSWRLEIHSFESKTVECCFSTAAPFAATESFSDSVSWVGALHATSVQT